MFSRLGRWKIDVVTNVIELFVDIPTELEVAVFLTIMSSPPGSLFANFPWARSPGVCAASAPVWAATRSSCSAASFPPTPGQATAGHPTRLAVDPTRFYRQEVPPLTCCSNSSLGCLRHLIVLYYIMLT